MEFSHLLAELKNASEEYGKDASQNWSETSQFCQTVCKVADNLEKHIKKYENQIIGLWVIYGYVTELYPKLERGQSTFTLCQKLFNVSAQIVLDVQFGQLDEDQPYKNNFRNTLTAFHQVVSEREGSSRFSVILSLMETHWSHPVLGQVMSNDEDDEEGSGLEYITSEDPDILRLRVEMMLQQNCEEFALNLCTWCLKHPALKSDLDIRQIQLTLMNKLHDLDRLQEEAETISLKECVALVQRFMELPKNQKVCTVLTQTFLVQNWIKEGDDEETIELFKLWIKHQYMVDEEEDKFISNLWAIAKLSRTTEQIVLIIDLIREKCGDSLLQFYTDMCIYAINIDKSVLEKSMQNGEMSEIQTHQQDMSLTCCKLADIFRYNKLKTARYSIVTAFSLNPSYSSLTKVESFYKSDNPALLVDTGQHIVAKCCGNCTYNRGVCTQKNKDEKDKINPATVYEVERLLNMLRPYHLKPELSWKELGPACTKYLQERERILALMAEAEAKKKAQPNQLSHQQLAASLREKLFVAAAAPVEPKPSPKPVPVPVATVEASTETKSYASNLQQVVENLQKRLGKAPASAHGKVRPRTGQSINLAKNSGNIVNSYSMNSANQLPTASQILAQKKSDAESIRQRTTQQIAATIQQTFLRQHEPEKPNFMVRVHNTNPNQVPTNTSIRQTFINPPNQPPQRFLSRPQEITKQYLIQLQQRQQASKVRMVKPQQVQSPHVQQTLKSPQQIIHSTVDSLKQFSNPSPQKIVHQKISPSGHTYSTIQVKKGQMVHGYQQLQNPVSQRTNQGIVSVGYQNTRPQLMKQTVQPSSQFQQRVQTTQIRSQNPQQLISSVSTVQSMKTAQTVVNRITIPSAQYTQGQKQPTSQEVIQQAKNQLYTLSQKKNPSHPLMRVNQPPDAQRMPTTNTSTQFIDPGSNVYSTSQGVLQMPSAVITTAQFQQAQQLLQTQSLNQGDVKPTKVRGLPISSSSAHQATLALADKSKIIKKRPVTASQNQLLAKAEAQGYASGKAVVKILQSQGLNMNSPTSPGSSQVIQAAPKLHPAPGNTQQLINVSPQPFGSRIVTLNQPQQMIQKTVIQSPTALPTTSIQHVVSNQPVYQQHVLSAPLNPVQTDLNTLLTVASANTRTNSSQPIAVMPTTMNVYRTMQQNVLNPTVLSVQSDLSSITPTIPQLDSQQFRQLQNQVTASQAQHTIPTPNLSAKQLQEELNKINRHSQQNVSSNPDMTITVKPSQHVVSSNLQKLQPNLLRPKIPSQSVAFVPKVAPRPASSIAYSPNQQVITQKSSPLSSSAPQLHRMLVQQESSQISKPVTVSSGLGNQSLSVYGNTIPKSGNVVVTSSQQFVPGVVKTEVVQQEGNEVEPPPPEQQSTVESVNSDKYAEEQKNIFVKSLLNASDEILETLSALPDPSLITDLFKNANPGDELHIALSDNIEDLGIDDMSSLIIPETNAESTAVQQGDNNVAEHVQQTNAEEYVPVELDPAAQSLRDVQGIHIPDYNEQYQVNSDSSSQQNMQFTMLNPSSHQINEAYGVKAESNEGDPNNMPGKASMMSKKCGSVFKCIICSSVFSTLESLQFHVQRVCKPDDSPTNIHDTLKLPDSKSGGINAKTIYQCVKCSSICISEKEMQLHTKNCPKDNSHLFGVKKSEHTSVLPSANKEYQSVKRLVEKQQMEIQREKEMIKAKKEKEQQLKKIQAQKVLQKQKELKLKREAAKLAKAPPPPRFKEMTSSSGKTFYKCDLCGQTFCSPEGVHDHWLPCLKKNPITKRIRRPNVEKQKLLENPEKFTKMMSTIFDSVHFAVKHLKIHTIIKSWKGHFFKCHLCNVKFNVYTKYVFHLKDHETEILMKISKMLGKDGSSKTGAVRPQTTDMKLSLMAARKSVKKHLSPLKKPTPINHSRKLGRPASKEKTVGLKKHRKDNKSDSDQRSQRRNVRAAHTQALSKIKNNANGFDILNTLPHFNVDVSSSGHSRSCSPEPMTTRRQTRSRRTTLIRKPTRETDEESSQPDMSEKEMDLSDKETENSQESMGSRDTEVKLSDLEAEEEATSETNDSQDKDTTDQDSVYKPSTSDDSQTSDHSSNLEAKGQSFLSSFMDFIGEETKEEEVTNENVQTSSSCSSLLGYRADPTLHRHLYKNIGKYKGTVIQEPKKIQRGRRSVAALDTEASKEKPKGRSRRLSDSDLLTKHKHLLSSSQLRIVLQKLPEHLTDQTPGKVESGRTSTSDDTIIERGLSEERRLDSPAVNSPSEERRFDSPVVNSPFEEHTFDSPSVNSPAISEVSSRARSEEVEVIMMADTSPSQVISCLLGSNTGSPPLAVVGNGNIMKAQKSSEIVKLDNEEDDIILIEKNSDDEEEVEDADDNTGGGDPVTVGASLTTCMVVKADTPTEGVKTSSPDLIIIENRSQPVNVYPNTAKNEVMPETKVEISQNNATEIHVVKGAKISLLADSEKLPISEDKSGSSNSQTADSKIDSQANLIDSSTSKEPSNTEPLTTIFDSSKTPSSNSKSSVLRMESKPESPIPAITSSESQDLVPMNPSSLPQPESPIPAINLPGSTELENTENQSDSPIPAIDSKTPTVMSTNPKSEEQLPQQLVPPEEIPEMKSKTETQVPMMESKSEPTTQKIQLDSASPAVTPNTESPIPGVELSSESLTIDADSKLEFQDGVKATIESPIPADNSKLKTLASNDKAYSKSPSTSASTERSIPAVESVSDLEVPAADVSLDAAPSHPQSSKSESPIPALSLDSKSSVVEIQSKTETASSSSEPSPDSPIPGVFLSDATQTSISPAADDLGPASVTTEEKLNKLSSKLFEALTKDLPQYIDMKIIHNSNDGESARCIQ
ncbi:hypothetical protein LOTGIDRAFT_168791 [Lottia gigantea]|uniref:C2H2-type domain-containing protein n=1 Tax=Lottia gigantea TaxID=225164 RepID=V3ZJE4_LOTGI|nr:hypothetical protein LOTGIDRAFT_168791 [Lottia gigantea]ESO84347.1 hypothetical protein LOTGIDRAFT_168791 [Lottia gigantea]